MTEHWFQDSTRALEARFATTSFACLSSCSAVASLLSFFTQPSPICKHSAHIELKISQALPTELLAMAGLACTAEKKGVREAAQFLYE